MRIIKTASLKFIVNLCARLEQVGPFEPFRNVRVAGMKYINNLKNSAENLTHRSTIILSFIAGIW